MKIGIDLDNTISATKESKEFFSLLTNLFKGKVSISVITNRPTDDNSVEEIKKELDDLHIKYDNLFVVSNKKEVILRENISIYFDDTDEYFIDLPEEVTVFKIREDGNFDFLEKKWIYGDKTGIKI